MKRLLLYLLCLLLICSLCASAEATGQVTDTLTIKVGYFGMDTDSYVQVASYHWSELYNTLPLYQNAYSFYRSSDDGNYCTVIDSAYGFYIADLLDYAGIYSGDVQSIAFYTQDQSVGYFTSFTYADLFYTQRYYFNDLSAYIRPVYDEEGNFTGYNADEAWNDCWTVQPMLALEDNWATYEIGTEHTAPNYASLGTGNRFRLLFGQSSPMECRTNQSAKYTHTLYITLQGAPTLKDEPPQIDGSIGSHSVRFCMMVGQQALRDALAQLLNISSSDSSVLEITGVTVTPDAEYSDLATVTLNYTVHGEGSADISFNFGSTPVTETKQVITHRVAPPEPTSNVKPNEPTEPSENGAKQQTSAPGTQNGNGEAARQSENANERETQAPVPSDTDVRKSTVRMYALSDSLIRQLAQEHPTQAIRNELQRGDGIQNVTALAVKEKSDRLILLSTGVAALVVSTLGALCALRYYSKGRKEQ